MLKRFPWRHQASENIIAENDAWCKILQTSPPLFKRLKVCLHACTLRTWYLLYMGEFASVQQTEQLTDNHNDFSSAKLYQLSDCKIILILWQQISLKTLVSHARDNATLLHIRIDTLSYNHYWYIKHGKSGETSGDSDCDCRQRFSAQWKGIRHHLSGSSELTTLRHL